MKQVVFEFEEQAVFERLNGFGSALGEDEDGRARLGRHLHRALPSGGRVKGDVPSEPFDYKALCAFRAALGELRDLFEPQTDPSWWTKAGAPMTGGAALASTDAVEGLARGRQYDIRNINDALNIVRRAILRCV